ncbi:MAG: double zinc ribbon domain-containing protein, partial [Patescibacteria group bacterium]|nr:double zinc ribbon domain-containing protein [Patescibacteria group bacterium]
MDFLSLIFPKHCVNCKKFGDYLCSNCFSYLSFDTEGLCVSCNRASINGLTHPGCATKSTIDGVFASISYKGVAKKLIYNFKYKPYLSDLSSLLIDLFFEGIIQNEDFNNVYQDLETDPVLVPIPLYFAKIRTRGYNQAEILAKGLSRKLNLKVVDLLRRTKKTRSQVGLLQ